MRKLNILKAIIDFLWITSVMATPFIILLIGITIFNQSLLGKYNIIMNGFFIENFTWTSKMVIILPMIAYLLFIYCLFLFRSTLRKLKELKIFSDDVISKTNTIGIILIFASFINSLPGLIYKQIRDSKISFDFGFNSFFMVLCLGLFFMVLSEIFKIAKNAKEENELTV